MTNNPNLTPETLLADMREKARLMDEAEEGVWPTPVRIYEWADLVEADREAAEWKRAFDEGEIVGMRSNATDAENPYHEGSNRFCGWSFGFWQSADRRRLEKTERERSALASFFWACRELHDKELEAFVRRMEHDPVLFAAGQNRAALAAGEAKP